jgi:Tfp pilus assembly protein PilF
MFRYPLAAAAILLVVLSLFGCQKKALPPAPPAPAVSDRLEVGKKAFAAGDCTTALPALAEAVREQPGSAEAYFLLGLCAGRQHEAGRAEEALRRAAALDPKDPRPLEALGILQYEAGRRAEAGESLAAAAARGSAKAQVAYYQGNLAMFAGDCPAALLAYRRAMTLDASFVPAQAEYQAARVACAKAEARTAAPASTPAVKPRPAPVAKPKPASPPQPAPAPQENPSPPAAATDNATP